LVLNNFRDKKGFSDRKDSLILVIRI